MVVALYSLANFPLITEKSADKKADESAKIIPVTYCISTLKMIYNPPTTINPNTISYQTTFLPNKSGSINDVKKAPIDRQAKVTDTLETLIALKNVNQCNMIINPANRKANNVFLGTCNGIFFTLIYTKINSTARSIRHQTNGKASNEIKAPIMAVKPQMNTIKCRCK